MPDSHGCREHGVYNSQTSFGDPLRINLAGNPATPYGWGVRWRTYPMAFARTVYGSTTAGGSRTLTEAECMTGSARVFMYQVKCAGYNTTMSDGSLLTHIPTLATDTFFGDW